MQLKDQIIILLTAISINACSTTQKLKPEDLLIPNDKPLGKSPETLAPSQVKADLEFLTYALNRGYAGRDYLSVEAYNKMIQNLDEIHGSMTPETFRDSIDEIFVDVPDNHLHARFNNKWSQYRDSKQSVGHVGNNFYKHNGEQPWSIETRKLKNKTILLISIASFPFNESPVWNGFFDQVQDRLPKSAAVILDMRGNGGGDDTTGLPNSKILVQIGTH